MDTARTAADDEDAKSTPGSPRFLHSAKSGDKEQARMLDPDNPLLEKFQKALKEHLLRQINNLNDDIFEYENVTKKNNAKREEIGLLVYEQQQALEIQQRSLDQHIAKLETTIAAREEIENVVAEKKTVFKKESEKMYETEAKEQDLRNEIESTNLLIQQMSQWEDALESDITVKKRVYEKTRKDKLKLLDEKRMQDALIYKLMTRIWYLERELERMDVQMKVKEEEREELAQTVALGNTNIEAMESEYRCLMHSWNSVVIAIGNRDKVVSCLSKEFSDCEERFKSILSETEQLKKLSQNEMRKNEEFTILKDRFVTDVQSCKVALDAEIAKKMAIERKMHEMEGIIEQTDADIEKLKIEIRDTETVHTALVRERETLDTEKGKLEEKIMRILEEQVSNNTATLTLRRTLKQLRSKNRELEIQVAVGENKVAFISSEIEAQRFANAEAQRYLRELDEQHRNLEKEADGYLAESKQLELRIVKRQRDIDILNTKYIKMVEKAGGQHGASPLETKINTLEKNIEEIQEENKKLQQFWLREQSNLIRISEERQEQIQNNNLIRKQILILEQKNLKVSDELEAFKKQQDKVLRSINNLHCQLTVMGDTFVRTKGLKINMDKDNEVMRQDYVYRLKDAELECLQLQDEIAQIEEDKVSMSDKLIEMNRQSLEWEKKFLSAKETKSTMNEERGQEGEVGTMKSEIHRMNVRYSQLKKVQDVLVHDLENCVSRRDAIVTTAEARERRTKGGMEKTRINFTRKLDDMRNRIKQMENQTEEMGKKMQALEAEKSKIQEEIKAMEDDMNIIQRNHEDMVEHIEEATTNRQMNFELLLQVQKKLNTYTDISKGRKPYMVHRTDSAANLAYKSQFTINSKLTNIIENLQSDFPNHVHELNRIQNTLKLPVLVYFR